ncbi:MAG: Mrp/NBP35 family ATP-binding protein [Planctomycetes bacterium]|nr:Mrp/NBP35 family ATP-binding protein [Planctomycetota bacterium]
MSQPTEANVLDALRQVIDPDLHKDIVSLGFITSNKVEGGTVTVTINLTTPACPMKEKMEKEARELLEAIPGVTEVNIEMTAVAPTLAEAKGIPGVRHVIAISSGKGGVGKSTLSVNLACALAQTGAKVGLLDCDVYGPDIPMMMGLKGAPEQVSREGGVRLLPKEAHGVKTMSIGYLIPEDQPAIWRGPMVHKLVQQFINDVEWGELDYLLVDMPPGTGDAQLSLANLVPVTGAVLVTTPQAVSTFDVGKAVGMFKQVNIKMLGIVENMAGITIEGKVEGAVPGSDMELTLSGKSRTVKIDENGKFSTVVDLFGKGGADTLCERFGLKNLGSVPLHPDVVMAGDGGVPIVLSAPESIPAQRIQEIAGRIAQRIAIQAFAELPVLQ